jgi:hypothetical protein
MQFKWGWIPLLFSTNIFAVASLPYIPPTYNLDQGSYEVKIKSSYFMSSGYTTPDGDLIDLQEGEGYATTNLGFEGHYGIGPQTQIGVGLNARYNQSIQIVDSEENPLSKFGMESLYLKVLYTWPEIEGLKYGINFHYGGTLFANETYDANTADYIILGDEGPYYGVGTAVTYTTADRNLFSFSADYRKPGKDLSAEIFSQVKGALMWRRLALWGGWEMNSSMNQDQYTNNPSEKPAQWVGPTAMYNSINRSWSAAIVGLGFSIGDKWRMEIEAKSRLSAKSADFGNELLITLASRKDKVIQYQDHRSQFKQYKVEAAITKSKGNAVIIDKGQANGVSKGMRFDLYKFDYLGGNKLIAVAYVVKASAKKSILKIVTWYEKLPLDDSIVVRGGQVDKEY